MNEYIGIVGHRNPGAAQEAAQDWTFSFRLLAYIKDDSAICQEEIGVFKNVTDEDLKSLMGQIVPYGIVKFKGKEIEAEGRKRIQMESFPIVGIDQPDLQALVQEYQTPVYYESPQFGKLKLDKAFDWYTGIVTWNNQKVSLELSMDDGPIEDTEKIAQTLWQNEDQWDEQIKAMVLKELLPLKNNDWLDENEKPLSPEEFVANLELEEISVNADGSFEFFYDDGYMFFGHCIIVEGTVEGGLEDATIAD